MRRNALSLIAAAAAALSLAACGGPSQSATGSVHPTGWGTTPSTLLATPGAATGATVEMGDAISLSPLQGLHYRVLAGYTAGFWRTYFTFVHAYPHAIVKSIAISARWHADCLDVEPRDAVPSEAGPWVLTDIRAGFRKPCLYADLSEMPAVKASLAASLGANWRARVWLWLAWYRFFPGLVSGYDAVQWTDHMYNRNLDESTVTLAFAGISPLPTCYHHRLTRTQCARVRARVASDDRASAASWRAWHRNGCPALLPHLRRYTRRGCAVLAQRGHYFTHAARALEARS